MGTRILRVLLVILAPAAFAQLDSNSITVTASRNVNLQPDQVVFGVFVDSGPDATLDEILAALKGSGITAANFSSVTTIVPGFTTGVSLLPPPALPPNLQSGLEWSFGLPVALAKIKDTVNLLTGLQQAIAQQQNGLVLSFTIQGTQVSQQLQQSQVCVVSDLIADAQSQAQKLAVAAGLGVGNILAMSSPVFTSVGNALTGVISRFTPGLTSPLVPVCTVTVKFALGRF